MKKIVALAMFAIPTMLVASTGCAVDASEEEPIEAAEGAASMPCKISRDKIMASVSGARKTVLQRGFRWWDKQVPYSQSKYFEGYRTDCSGFVSMCWETGTSYTTAEFINDKHKSYLLPGYTSLVPGDALVRHVTHANAHIVLFLGWNDANKTSACVLEQASTADDMEFRTRSVDALKKSNYKAIRAKKFKSSGGPKPAGLAGELEEADDEGAEDE